MQYIETIWPSIYWKFWVKHSSFIKDNTVLSYEMDKPLWQGKFKIYNAKEYLRWKLIICKKDVKDFAIEHYEGIKYSWIVCFEALNLIAKENWVDMSDINDKRLKPILYWIAVLILYTLIVLTIGIYWFTESPESFISNNKNVICQEE